MTTTVVNNPDRSRYEISIDGELAGVAVYELGENSIDFTHTQVETDSRERGLGGNLVGIVRTRHRDVPVCDAMDLRTPGLPGPAHALGRDRRDPRHSENEGV
jgi:predicted GNAT family acetyltransferase